MDPIFYRPRDLYPCDLDSRGRTPDGTPYRSPSRRHRQRPHWLRDLINWTRP